MQRTQRKIPGAAMAAVLCLAAGCGGDDGPAPAAPVGSAPAKVRAAAAPAAPRPSPGVAPGPVLVVASAAPTCTQPPLATAQPPALLAPRPGDLAAQVLRAGDPGGPTGAAGVSATCEPPLAAPAPPPPPPMARFMNLGNTCYANATLKFLIASLGAQRLQTHLAEQATQPAQAAQRSAAQSFGQLIRSAQQPAVLLQQELLEFFTGLQSLRDPAFASAQPLFPDPLVGGAQQDAHDFLLRLVQAFGLEQLREARVGTWLCLEEGAAVVLLEAEPPQMFHHVGVTQAGATLQEVVAGLCPPADTAPAGLEWRLAVADVQQLERLGLHIFSPEPQWLAGLDFEQPVQMTVLDRQQGRRVTVTLQATQLVMHQGSYAQGGHYVAYLRNAQGAWERHDDAQEVTLVPAPLAGMPKLINFTVVGRSA